MDFLALVCALMSAPLVCIQLSLSFVSASEVCLDRTQISGWKDLLLQHRDQAVHMGETR